MIFEDKPYKIYDNVFDLGSQIRIFDSLTKLNYFLGWEDRVDRINFKYLHSTVDINWVKSVLFYKSIINKEIFSFIEERNFNSHKIVVNTSFPGYHYVAHTHEHLYTLVYYANLEWQENWAGETLIYNGSGKEANDCIPYIPNRMVLMDKNIPHALRPPTFAAPFYRFTVSMFFK